MADHTRQLLISGLKALDLAVEPSATEALMDYLDLLQRWNKAYNLTAVRDPEAMVIRHLLDSLSIVPWINGQRIIDVGTGAGLPGVPLAILMPERHIALLDSNGKKTRFLFQVKSQLGLSNIEIIEKRVENYQPGQLFDVVVSRAFANLDRMVDHCDHLLSVDGEFVAMKAAAVTDEIAELDGRVEVVDCRDLTVPFLGESRALVTLKKRPVVGQG